jgi:hypothetical protein
MTYQDRLRTDVRENHREKTVWLLSTALADLYKDDPVEIARWSSLFRMGAAFSSIGGAKTPFLAPFSKRDDTFPRQARDAHKETSKKKEKRRCCRAARLQRARGARPAPAVHRIGGGVRRQPAALQHNSRDARASRASAVQVVVLFAARGPEALSQRQRLGKRI